MADTAGLYVLSDYVDAGYLEVYVYGNATEYCEDDYVVADYYESGSLIITSELSATANLGRDLFASAELTSSVSVSALGGRIITIDDPYPPYTWDSTGSTYWDDWPNNIWGGLGITMQCQSSIEIVPGLLFAADSELTAQFATTVQGNFIFGAQASLASEFLAQTQGNFIFAGAAVLPVVAAIDSAGNYILFGDSAFAVTANLGVTGGLAQFSGALLVATFGENIDQSGLNGTAGIRFNAQAFCVNEAGFIVDQSGLNGTAGIFFRAVPVVLEAFNSTMVTGVFIYRDPYRFIRVPMENRVLKVLPRGAVTVGDLTRIIAAQQETRVFRVAEETRILTEGVPEYENYRRRKI